MLICAWAYLEHLNECDAEVQVRQVSAYKTKTVNYPDGKDSPYIHARVHANILSAIEESRRSSHDLCHYRRKEKVPCCEQHRVSWMVDLAIATIYCNSEWLTEFLGVEDPFVE